MPSWPEPVMVVRPAFSLVLTRAVLQLYTAPLSLPGSETGMGHGQSTSLEAISGGQVPYVSASLAYQEGPLWELLCQGRAPPGSLGPCHLQGERR